MKKRILSALLCVAMVASLVVGCGGKEEPAAAPEAPAATEEAPAAEEEEAAPEIGGTIEVAVTFTDTKLAVFEEIVADFQDETGVTVDLITPGDDYENQLKTMLASRSLPDVWETHGWSLIRYGHELAPVNDQPWFSTMDTDTLGGVMADENGTFYALGVTSNYSGLIYNQDVLDKAGVDKADLKTWEQLEAACEKIKAIGVTPIIAGGSLGGNLAGFLGSIAPAFWTDQGAVVDGGQALKDGTFDFDTHATELLTYFADHFIKKGYLNEDVLTLDSVGAQQALGAGEAAFMFRGSDNIAVAKEYYPDANLGILPVPASQESAKPSWRLGEASAFGVWKDSENIDAAWAFLAFLARPENATKIAIACGGVPAIEGMDIGESPTYAAIMEGEEYVGDWDQYDNVFDRSYFPSGMWGVMGQVISMTISSPDDVTEAVAFLKDNYLNLYAEQH